MECTDINLKFDIWYVYTPIRAGTLILSIRISVLNFTK